MLMLIWWSLRSIMFSWGHDTWSMGAVLWQSSSERISIHKVLSWARPLSGWPTKW
jgi:hypothetical protein